MESSIVPDNGKRMRELIGKWKYHFTLNFVTVEKFFYNTYFCVHLKKQTLLDIYSMPGMVSDWIDDRNLHINKY